MNLVPCAVAAVMIALLCDPARCNSSPGQPLGMPYRSVQSPAEDMKMERGWALDHWKIFIDHPFAFANTEWGRNMIQLFYAGEGLKAAASMPLVKAEGLSP
ncbi:hypothetical protein HDE_14347 [Halotydeus destructor]|nr:hypothetical protein HDE_14347 [Halotydeus destructor]